MVAAWPKVIVHADMDAFYAAVEQRDRPELRGKPVLIGMRGGRGVVLTASYEARPYQVGSAMPMAWALRNCPHAIVVPPRFKAYEAASRKIMAIFRDFSPDVEPLSLDEAFIDMTGAKALFGGPFEIGRRLKAAVREATGLNISVGISGTKYVAKVASDFDKPNGLTVVPHSEAVGFLAPLPVKRLWGAGPKTAARLEALGYRVIADVAHADPAELERQLGSAGRHFHALANARDPRRVIGHRRAKSIGSERTLAEDVRDQRVIRRHLREAADEIGQRLRKNSLVACGVRVKLKTRGFQLMSRQTRLPAPTQTAAVLYGSAVELLAHFEHREPYRLVGMAAYDLVQERPLQLDLFDGSGRDYRLERTVDTLRERFGDAIVARGDAVGQDRTRGPNRDSLAFTPDDPGSDPPAGDGV